MSFSSWSYNTSIEKTSPMAGAQMTRGSSLHFDLISLKNFSMKQIKFNKLLASAFCFTSFLLFACKENPKEKAETTTSNASVEHAAIEAPKDNEVKAEAPDAKVKIEQGYALPSHSENLQQSPIDIISGKTDKAASEHFTFAFHTDINAVENLGHTIQVDFSSGSTCGINGKSYTAKQFHFHTPSEHLVDGMTFPIEMHIVMRSLILLIRIKPRM